MDETQPHPPLGVTGPATLLAERYLLGGQIGHGGAAEVYRAWDEKLERAVAVKLYRLDAPGLDDAARHRAEMRILASLNHPGLVAIYDAGVEQRANGQSRPFLVMELVDGPSLAQQLAAGPLAVGDTAQLALRLAGALAYIHEQGIVHRDVKPANVLLDKRSPALAKLTDFGIARSAHDTRLTGAGLTIGTAHYLSPEQALGGVVGPASDVYSLGLLLLECQTGQPAFPGTPIESALARLHRDPEVGDGVGSELAPLLTAMTAREPQDRPTAAEVARSAAELAGSTAELPLAAAWAAAGAGTTALLPPVREAGVLGAPGPGAGGPSLAGKRVTWRPTRRDSLVAAAAALVLIGAVATAVGLSSTERLGGIPAGISTSRPPSSTPAAVPVRSVRTSTHPPTSSHPVPVVVSTPSSPKPRKGHPAKHGH